MTRFRVVRIPGARPTVHPAVDRVSASHPASAVALTNFPLFDYSAARRCDDQIQGHVLFLIPQNWVTELNITLHNWFYMIKMDI